MLLLVTLSFLPRLLRLRIAPAYLGMNKNSFNKLVRPAITTIPIGKRAIAFDRLELDTWAESYCRCNGRPARKKEGQLCRNDELQGSVSGSESVVRLSGTSTNASSDSED